MDRLVKPAKVLIGNAGVKKEMLELVEHMQARMSTDDLWRHADDLRKLKQVIQLHFAALEADKEER